MHCRITHVLSVSGEVSKLHHLVAKLAENLDKLLEGADSFQMVQGHQHLRGGDKACASDQTDKH